MNDALKFLSIKKEGGRKQSLYRVLLVLISTSMGVTERTFISEKRFVKIEIL